MHVSETFWRKFQDSTTNAEEERVAFLHLAECTSCRDVLRCAFAMRGLSDAADSLAARAFGSSSGRVPIPFLLP